MERGGATQVSRTMWRNERANNADADQVWRETPTQEEHRNLKTNQTKEMTGP